MQISKDTYNFLTEEELANNRKALKFDLVGELKTPPTFSDRVLENLSRQFVKYPVEWANSKDRLYHLPYEDDFFTALAKEKAKNQEEKALRLSEQSRKNLNAEPWTYQVGYIFIARKQRETERAYLVRLKGFGTTWVPKSQVDFHEPEIWLPEWFMKEKGLTPADAPLELNPPFEWEPALIPKQKEESR